MKKIITAAAVMAGIGLVSAMTVGSGTAYASEVWVGVNNNVDAGPAQTTVGAGTQVKLRCQNAGCYKTGSSGETIVPVCTKDYPVGQATIVAIPYGPIAMGSDDAIATVGLTDAGAVVRQNCDVYKVTGN